MTAECTWVNNKRQAKRETTASASHVVAATACRRYHTVMHPLQLLLLLLLLLRGIQCCYRCNCIATAAATASAVAFSTGGCVQSSPIARVHITLRFRSHASQVVIYFCIQQLCQSEYKHHAVGESDVSSLYCTSTDCILKLFHNHRSLPVPICGYHIQTLLTFSLASLHYLSPPFLLPSLFPPSALLTFLPSLSTLLLYMPTIFPYSCCIGLYCTISSCTGFATRDDAYDAGLMLDLHHNAEL